MVLLLPSLPSLSLNAWTVSNAPDHTTPLLPTAPTCWLTSVAPTSQHPSTSLFPGHSQTIGIILHLTCPGPGALGGPRRWPGPVTRILFSCSSLCTGSPCFLFPAWTLAHSGSPTQHTFCLFSWRTPIAMLWSPADHSGLLKDLSFYGGCWVGEGKDDRKRPPLELDFHNIDPLCLGNYHVTPKYIRIWNRYPNICW